MERNIDSLLDYQIEGTDGEAGKTEDFYFDDKTSAIRYVIVKTGSWLSGREVLISTNVITKTDSLTKTISINLSQEQIQLSPDIDTDKPVFLQKEAMLNQRHFWKNFAGSGYYGGEMGIENNAPVRLKPTDRDPKEDNHLRSVVQVGGYAIHASNGEIGYVKDFIIDDQSWKVLALVVETHNWIGGKKVVVDISHVKAISFIDWTVYLNISMEAVNESKLFEKAEYIAQ